MPQSRCLRQLSQPDPNALATSKGAVHASRSEADAYSATSSNATSFFDTARTSAVITPPSGIGRTESTPHSLPPDSKLLRNPMPSTFSPSKLDKALFGAPFIVIDAHNATYAITHDLAEAASLVNAGGAARAIVGTLIAPMIAVDIDPTDTGEDPEAGETVADQLTLWAESYGVPWLRRDSGRPGHVHLVIKVPGCLRDELQVVVRMLALRQNVSATVRSTLRLTSSPHRNGLFSPIRAGTLVAADGSRRPPSRPRGAARTTRRRPSAGRSRSEGEYGHALALARAGHTSTHAWSFANLAGTKARDIGESAWRRWFWAPATTVAAAENGLTEQQAWSLFHDASPVQAAHVGRDGWRRSRWLPALREAAEARPRRRRLGTHRGDGRRWEPVGHELRKVQASLQAVLDNRLGLASQGKMRPHTIGGVRVNSLRAALAALAHAIVTTRGSISVRDWAERAHLDPKTIRRARDVALDLKIVERVHNYAGGTADCDAFSLVVDSRDDSNTTATSPTLYTPRLGQADAHRLKNQHQSDRLVWARHLEMQVSPVGKELKSSDPASHSPTSLQIRTQILRPPLADLPTSECKHTLRIKRIQRERIMNDQTQNDNRLTPAQRSMRARVAANTSWSRTEDRTRRTAPARQAALDKFERLVDPDGVLDRATRAQRAEAAKRAHFQRLALLSSRARRRGSGN